MSPELITIVLIALAFVAGLLVGAHNAAKVNADLAATKAELNSLKTLFAHAQGATPPAPPQVPGPVAGAGN